jgi:HAMP domain-containing protein
MSYVYVWFRLEQRVEELERNSAKMNEKQLGRLEDLRDAVRTHRDEAEFVKSLAV